MVAAILITCTQSFSNNKHKGNCGGGGGGGEGNSCTCGQHLHVRNETQSSARLSKGKSRGHYSRGRKQLESGFAGNIVVNIEG